MQPLATGTALPPGLPARTGDAPTDIEKTGESAIFEAFLSLALNVASLSGSSAAGPEGKGDGDAQDAGASDLAALTGNPALPGGKTLPDGLPLPLLLPIKPAAPAPVAETLAAETAAAPPVATPQPDIARPRHVVPLFEASLTKAPSEAASAPDAPLVEAPFSVTLTSREAARAALRLELTIASLTKALSDAREPAPPAPALAAQSLPETPSAPARLTLQALASPTREMLARRSAEPQAVVAAPVLAPTGASDGITPVAAIAPADTANDEPPPQGQPLAGREAAAQPRKDTTAPEPATKPAPLELAAAALPAAPSEASPVLAETRPAAPIESTSLPRRSEAAPGPRDFSELVDALARAREASAGEVIRTTLATREFGTVAMQMRSDEGRLHVAMSAADPGFALAVQAASAAFGSSLQQGSPDSSAQQQQQQQQQGQLSNSSAQSQTTSEGQARQQQPAAERSSTAQRDGQAGNTSDDQASDERTSGGEPGGSIYA
jgi:hypothetical protein